MKKLPRKIENGIKIFIGIYMMVLAGAGLVIFALFDDRALTSFGMFALLAGSVTAIMYWFGRKFDKQLHRELQANHDAMAASLKKAGLSENLLNIPMGKIPMYVLNDAIEKLDGQDDPVSVDLRGNFMSALASGMNMYSERGKDG